MTKTRGYAIAAGLLLAACSDSGPSFGPETEATPTQRAAIRNTEQSLATLAKVDSQGSTAGLAAIQLATSTGLLIQSGHGTAFEPHGMRAGSLATLDGCAITTANSITWHQCMQSGYTIDGTISWSPGHVDMNLHVSGTSSGYSFDYALSGSMTVSATAIQGDAMLSVSASYAGNHASETIHTQIDVKLTQGCISSGTLTVTESGSGPGAINGAVQIIWTGCEMFRVRNA